MGLLPILVLLVIALLVGVSLKQNRWGSRDVVRSTGTIALLGAVISGIAIVVNIVRAFAGDTIAMTVPVAQFWPELNPGVTVEGPTAHVVDGGFSSADVTVQGLDGSTRVLWSSGEILGLLVPFTICLLVLFACWKLLRGDPFAPLVGRVAGWTATAVLVGGMGSQVMEQIAGSRAADALLHVTGYTAPDVHGQPLPTGLPHSTGSWSISFWPVGAALLIAAFAAMLRYGRVLQRELQGLV